MIILFVFAVENNFVYFKPKLLCIIVKGEHMILGGGGLKSPANFLTSPNPLKGICKGGWKNS